jgi:adenylylsulfate kinase
MINRKILIMGLPGSGKTTLSKALAPLIGAVAFNADAVRANINKDLGFTLEDRIEQARRMGWLCDRVLEAGHSAIADFVCPTPETRVAFGDAFTIFVDRVHEGRFADTNRIFTPPERVDVHVDVIGSPEQWADHIALALEGQTSTRPQTAEITELAAARAA